MTQPALQNTVDDIGVEATRLQMLAANPLSNVWVNASAGTGKTRVLTDRVLRLLLPIEGQSDGTSPQNILCVTFTKAGANEMITRIMETLSHWAVCENSTLEQALENLLGHPPTLKQRDKARRLYAQIVDLSNGLNATTIHALCQSILGRFTMEAGLPPNFSVMDEGEAMAVLRTVRDSMVRDILDNAPHHPLYESFSWLATRKNSDQINKIFNAALGQRQKLAVFFDAYPDYKNTLRLRLQIGVNDTHDDLIRHAMIDTLPEDDIRILAKAFEHGGSRNKQYALDIYNVLNGNRIDKFQKYKSIFLTEKNTIKAGNHGVSKDARVQNPLADDLFNAEGQRLIDLQDSIKMIHLYHATVALLDMTRNIIDRYQDQKTRLRKLDYDDLIHKTYDLLQGENRQWVLFKLDYGIDHILVDEAQDTSPDQWGILKALWDDFFSGDAGETENGIERTVFVVGDNKQSIFSFQGANLDTFNTVHDTLMTHVKQGQKSWADVPMNTSFRSVSAVLDIVDAVFQDGAMRRSLTQNPENYRSHIAHRQGHAGRVELWPIYKAQQNGDRPTWDLPLIERDSVDANRALAERIAMTIAEWLENKTTLPSKNRAIHAGDIMILVRRRNALVNHLIRALKSHNVPVSGADRLVIADHIGVQDVLAALSFAIMPEDDLTLAALLKSPLIGWDDTTLEEYAHARDKSLWYEIKTYAPDHVVQWLSSLINAMAGQSAFHAISHVLNMKSMNISHSGWQALITRLGDDCIDPLEELLAMAQSYDADHPASGIQGFLHFMQTNTTDIKRELDASDNKVRIMTVHASKGLQAPIVFMPDTTGLPSSGTRHDDFFWLDDTMPLWSSSSNNDPKMIQSFRDDKKSAELDEYYRLLYVAMTRAEDRLIICGTLNGRQSDIPDGSWYQCVENAMVNIGSKSQEWNHDDSYMPDISNKVCLIFETQQTTEPKADKPQSTFNNTDNTLPSWVTKSLKPEQTPPRVLRPSQDESDTLPVRSPLSHSDDAYRFRRGLLTHSLLQYLPDIPVEKREAAAQYYLSKQAPDVSDDVRNSILAESMTILDEFPEFFATGSYTEVPVTGTIKRDNGAIDIISGQIDRLLVTDDTVWIIDFKSNRPPPRDPANIPAQYQKQLAAYKTLIQDIYPHHDIRCALLWTDGPFMTELTVI